MVRPVRPSTEWGRLAQKLIYKYVSVSSDAAPGRMASDFCRCGALTREGTLPRPFHGEQLGAKNRGFAAFQHMSHIGSAGRNEDKRAPSGEGRSEGLLSG